MHYPTGVAVIGAGAVGRRFIDLMDDHPGFRVVSVADTDPSRLPHSWTTSPVLTADTAQAISADGVNLVYVAVPPAAHAKAVRLAVEHGRAVLCEKPLGTDLEQSRRLVGLVNGSGLPAAVNFVHAAAPGARALQERVGAAAAPQRPVRGLRITIDLLAWPRPFQAHATWLAHRVEGGPTREMASHFLFLAARLLGPLHLQQHQVTYPDGPDGQLAESGLHARLVNATGVPVDLDITTGTSQPRTELLLHLQPQAEGNAETLALRDFYDLRRQAADGDHPLLPASLSTPQAAYLAALDDLSDLLRSRPHTTASFAEALAVQSLVEALLKPVKP